LLTASSPGFIFKLTHYPILALKGLESKYERASRKIRFFVHPSGADAEQADHARIWGCPKSDVLRGRLQPDPLRAGLFGTFADAQSLRRFTVPERQRSAGRARAGIQQMPISIQCTPVSHIFARSQHGAQCLSASTGVGPMIRSDSPSWIASKATGDRAERELAEFFRGRGWSTFQAVGRADFDLLLTCEVEVKRDLKTAETGNVAVEVSYHGQPSGLLKSSAAFWAFVLDCEAVLIKTGDLRNAVLTGKYREVRAGDGHAATVKLVPVATLKALKGAHVVPL
jgi:hypothetical protein